jgi:hypothetical protein
LVVYPTENWATKNASGPFDGARNRRVLLQGEMRAYLIEGRFPDDWWYAMPNGGLCDASATVDTLIGGRADWALIKNDIERMLAALPKHYYPGRDGQPGSFVL